MKEIIQIINGIHQLTAQYNHEFKSISFEGTTELHDGRKFIVSRMPLRKEDVQAMFQYFDELEK